MKLYYDTPTGEYEFEVDIQDLEKAIAEIFAKDFMRKLRLESKGVRSWAEMAVKTFLADTGVLHHSKEFEDFFTEHYDDDLKEYFLNAAMEEYEDNKSDIDPYEGAI